MNVVDSSGWLEYFGDGPNAPHFAGPLGRPEELIVPVISVFEVFKRVLQQRDEASALQAAALMQQGQVVALDAALAMAAAKLSFELKLPMADSIILATARQFNAVFWTQDADFENMPGVRYVAAVRA
ncbi:MAG TPA: type II toxin-antitoxin system VapC family toxin [Rubrivivax sp.]|nr:type II toxin-antitoxin system VapC family toxin [Rubrivivax sp.]